jgi:hypothetical protein
VGGAELIMWPAGLMKREVMRLHVVLTAEWNLETLADWKVISAQESFIQICLSVSGISISEL